MMITVMDGVRSLVDKSLLWFSASGEDEPRLSFMELIRAYAIKQLAECGELIQARDAHAAFYLELAEKALCIAETKRARWQEVLEREAGNMRAAMEWLLERKKGEDALRLGSALVHCRSLSGILNDGCRFLQSVLEVSEKNQGSLSPTIQTQALIEPLLQPSYSELTFREIEVLRLLATGMSNKKIAECLVLSPNTVNVHIHSIFSKIDVHSRTAATRYALDNQIV
jgi:DNA-binding CsgD family transcriptional regulator